MPPQVSRMINHGIPNRSTTISNRNAQKVSAIGICTMPFPPKH
jgi:hypothetical protein